MPPPPGMGLKAWRSKRRARKLSATQKSNEFMRAWQKGAKRQIAQ